MTHPACPRTWDRNSDSSAALSHSVSLAAESSHNGASLNGDYNSLIIGHVLKKEVNAPHDMAVEILLENYVPRALIP